jgi:hypothetical protein
MRRGTSVINTNTIGATFWIVFAAGCFPTTNGGSDGGGGGGGFAGPTLELTVNGVHFGPATPDPGAAADLVTSHDPITGRSTGASFRLSATIGTAGCALAFDRYGDGVTLGAGQYTVASQQGATTLDGTVYPTTAERFSTPEGGAGCSGSGCDGAAFALNAVDATHATGYFMGTIVADSGAGQASVVCSFWVPTRSYQP